MEDWKEITPDNKEVYKESFRNKIAFISLLNNWIYFSSKVTVEYDLLNANKRILFINKKKKWGFIVVPKSYNEPTYQVVPARKTKIKNGTTGRVNNLGLLSLIKKSLFIKDRKDGKPNSPVSFYVQESQERYKGYKIIEILTDKSIQELKNI